MVGVELHELRIGLDRQVRLVGPHCHEERLLGIALLGAIWTTRCPLESFLKVQEALSLIEQA